MARRGPLSSRIGCSLALLFFLASCASPPADRADARACPSPRSFHVVRHGGHTGIVVERRDLLALLPALAADIGREGYVEIGWGEERYYQAGTGTVSLALRAALRPNKSVLQVVAFAGPPGSHSTQEEVVEIRVDEAGYRRALGFIAETFMRAPDGTPMRLGPALAGPGWFYRAEGTFHLFNTCNSWVARAVEASGYPVSSTLALTAGDLIERLREGQKESVRCEPQRVSP